MNVGDTQTFDCVFDLPVDLLQKQNIVTWRRYGFEAPIFTMHDNFPPRMDASYQGRLLHVGGASIKLNDIKTTDEGLYECFILILDKGDDRRFNGTSILLSVNCE